MNNLLKILFTPIEVYPTMMTSASEKPRNVKSVLCDSASQCTFMIRSLIQSKQL